MRLAWGLAALPAAALGQATPFQPYTLTQFQPAAAASATQPCNVQDVLSLFACEGLCVNLAGCAGVFYASGTKKCTTVTTACKPATSGFEYYRLDRSSEISCGQRQFDLIWVVDESGSVGAGNFKLMSKFINDVTASLSHNVQERNLVNSGYITFSDWVNFDFAPTSNKAEFESKVLTKAFLQGATNIQDGLVSALAARLKSPRKTVVVLLTDGLPNRVGQRPQKLTANVTPLTVQAAKNLVAPANTALIYARIADAQQGLFSGVPFTTDQFVGGFSTANFVSFSKTLFDIIGRTVCVTDTPTAAPTGQPTGRPTTKAPTAPLPTFEPTQKPTAPTGKPSTRPTLAPTRSPTTLPPSTCTVLTKSRTLVDFPGPAPAALAVLRDAFKLSFGTSVAAAAGGKASLVLSDGDATKADLALQVFSQTPQNLVGGFISEFVIEVDDPAQWQGFAFVMHRDPQRLLNLPAATGRGLGYRGIQNAVIIAFDMCDNRGGSFQTACLEQDLRLEYSPAPGLVSPPTEEGQSFNIGNLARSASMRVNVEYFQQARRLRVYATYGAAGAPPPAINRTNDLIVSQSNFQVEQITGGVDAFLGFTSANGATPTAQRVTSWTVKTIPVIFSQSQITDALAQALEVPADGKPARGLTVQLMDDCNNEVRYGGQGALMQALYVPQPAAAGSGRLRALADAANASAPAAVVVATAQDNDNGTYTGVLATKDVNVTYDAYFSFGVGCGLALDKQSGKVTQSGSGDCFFQKVPGAVRSVPPPPVPDQGQFTPDTVPGKQPNIGAIAAGGGIAALFLIGAAVGMRRYRNKWREDKGYIEAGNLYNLEKDITYAAPDTSVIVARQVVATKEEILREKKQADKASRADEVAQLEREKDELQEQLRAAKQAKAESSSLVQSGNPAYAGNKKKEFMANQATL